MRIGIDIDGTITDVNDKLKNAKFQYTNRLNKHFSELSREDNKEFLKTIHEEITFSAEPRQGAVQAIKELHDMGNEIYIITSRCECYHVNVYERTYKWLIENNILFDKLIVNALHKEKICVENDIDLIIDDKLRVCIECTECGIQAINIKHKSQKINAFSNTFESARTFPMFTDWEEILECINSTPIISIILYNDVYKNEICNFVNESMHKFIHRPYKRREDVENINDYYFKKGGIFFLAIDVNTNKIIGSIALEARYSYGILKRFYVDSNYQNKGVGQRLFACLEAFIVCNTSYREIYLTCGNILETAHRFYNRNGFKQINKPDIDLHYADDDDFFVKYYDSNTEYTCMNRNYSICHNCDRVYSKASRLDASGNKIESIGCMYAKENLIYDIKTKECIE